MRLYKKTVFILIFILVIPFVNAVDCYDSDGGSNYSVRGCVTFLVWIIATGVYPPKF